MKEKIKEKSDILKEEIEILKTICILTDYQIDNIKKEINKIYNLIIVTNVLLGILAICLLIMRLGG